MNLPCPKCKSRTVIWRAQAGTAGPAAARCERCHGLWLPRRLIDGGPVDPLADGDDLAPPDSADHHTGLCPEGHGILIRARVDLDEPFYLERCQHCRGIWFDAGEWQRLAAAHLLEHIDDLWDPLWRRQQRVARRSASLDHALAEALGDDLFARLAAIAGEISHHPAREQALAWLKERATATNERIFPDIGDNTRTSGE